MKSQDGVSHISLQCYIVSIDKQQPLVMTSVRLKAIVKFANVFPFLSHPQRKSHMRVPHGSPAEQLYHLNGFVFSPTKNW